MAEGQLTAKIFLQTALDAFNMCSFCLPSSLTTVEAFLFKGSKLFNTTSDKLLYSLKDIRATLQSLGLYPFIPKATAAYYRSEVCTSLLTLPISIVSLSLHSKVRDFIHSGSALPRPSIFTYRFWKQPLLFPGAWMRIISVW